MPSFLLNDFDPFAELYTRRRSAMCALGASQFQVGAHFNLLVEVVSA